MGFSTCTPSKDFINNNIFVVIYIYIGSCYPVLLGKLLINHVFSRRIIIHVRKCFTPISWKVLKPVKKIIYIYIYISLNHIVSNLISISPKKKLIFFKISLPHQLLRLVVKFNLVKDSKSMGFSLCGSYRVG